jgi:hypothetical protein
MNRFISRLAISVACLACFTALNPFRADASHVYHFDIGGDPVFSGTPPAATAPWVDAYFFDVAPGTVLLTISNAALSSVEKLTEFYINLDPTKDPTSLNFTSLGSSGGFSLPTIDQGVDGFKADGDGKYDVRFNFGQPPASAFTSGEYITYQISGISGLVAADFIYLSMPAGGHGPFYAAGHVQGIDASNVTDEGSLSGWIAPSEYTELPPIPEPGSASILALAAGILFRRYLARSRQA